MNSWQQLSPILSNVVLPVALNIVLMYAAALIVERTIVGALNAVKFALKLEFSTATGRVNLLAMILLVVLFVFSDLHEFAANALSVEKPAPAGKGTLVAITLLGLFFVGSVVCVLISEKWKTQNGPPQ